MLALLASAGVHAEPKTSGVDIGNIDSAVRPQDNFFLNLNGKWLASTEIPSDKASWGSFEKLDDDTKPQLRAIIEAAAGQQAAGRKRSASAISSPATWMRRGWSRSAWRR
jgi:predicted metalloendopeptidase